MTMNDPTPLDGATGPGSAPERSRRPPLHDMTRLDARTGDADGAADPRSADPRSTEARSTEAPSIEAQVHQVDALLAAVRESIGSLAEASLRLERQVGEALHAVPARPPAPARDHRPSAAHPAQAAVEQAALLEAVENRAVIEQAKGMLMLKHRCDAEAAFGLLVEISRRERRKVRDIAGDIVRSGSAPRRVVDVTDAAVGTRRVAHQTRTH